MAIGAAFRRGLTALAVAAAMAAPVPSLAQDYADGEAAYLARDWAAAKALWQAEAAAGSAQAMLGLGNLYDFGLLGAPDPERAFSLYMAAAKGGNAEAAFNVAVMHDSGIGTPADLSSAAAWYSFAALGGHARAGYNLGQLFGSGSGVAQSQALAAFWFERAARAIPAAADALEALGPVPPGDGAPTSPDPLGAEVFEMPEGPLAMMAWQDQGAAPDASYRVEMVQIVEGGLVPLTSASAEGSAASVPLPDATTRFAWRVSQIADEGYAASDWLDGSGAPLGRSPIGSVRFEYALADRRAQGLAFRLGGAMTRADAIVSYLPVEGAIASSGVAYGYAQDAGFAADVSAFVPGIGAEGAELTGEGDLAPGEVRISLAFETGG